MTVRRHPPAGLRHRHDRPPDRRRAATVVASVLAVASSIVGLAGAPVAAGAQVAPAPTDGSSAPAAAPAADATVVVSETAEIDEAGEVLTVTGSGFDPAAHVGTRPPLAGQPSGVYLVFGRFDDPWQPSAGAPSSAREVLTQKWVLPAASRAVLDPAGTNPDLVTLTDDGSFTAELAVAPGGTTTGRYAIVTYAGSGAVDATQETLTPLAFASTPTPEPPPSTPGTGTGPKGQTLTVTPTTELEPGGQELLIEGAGYDPATGVYVALCADQGPNLPPSPCVGGSGESEGPSASAWITDDERFASLRSAPFGAGGTFSVTIAVTAADDFVDCYDPDTSCVVATRADHTATADRSADVKVPVYFTGQTPPADPDPPTPPAATASIDRTSVVAGEAITVTGDGFVAGEQVQVWLHSDPQLLGVVVADSVGAVSATVTVPVTTEAGTHHLELYGITSALRLTSADFTVVAAAVTAAGPPTPTASDPIAAAMPTAGGTLPATGPSSVPLALAGAGLVALGIALTGGARRRAVERGPGCRRAFGGHAREESR